MKKRETGFELLRIIAMAMIITLHYITKGGVIHPLYEDGSLWNHFWYGIEAFASSSVNAYVLITGYFLADSSWSIKKVFKLWLQVFTYSLLITLVLAAVGLVDISSLQLGDWQKILMPVTYEHYWFATVYLFLYMLAPVLIKGAYELEQKQFKSMLSILVAVFGGLKSICPYLIPWDKYGFDLVWFVILFLTAVYIRRFGLPILNTTGKSLLAYVALSLLSWIICILTGGIARATGKLWYYCDMVYSYNYITIYLASIALFMVFFNMESKKVFSQKRRLSKFLETMGKCCFGVYLLHEHFLLRESWQRWLGINVVQGRPLQLLHWLLCVVIILAAGAGTEFIRQLPAKIVKHKNNLC